MKKTEQYETVLNNIKNLISAKGMKQGTVAKRAGFSQSDFSNILNEKRKLLRVEHILPIAEALEVDVNALYYPPEKGERTSMVLKGILAELREIRKELQIIHNEKEFNEFVPEDSDGICSSHSCVCTNQKSFR